MTVRRPTGFRGVFRDDDEARAVYADAAGIGRIVPSAVAVPADPDDVCSLVAWAARTGTALVPRGSGSSMGGGAIGSGVIVDLSRLRRLDEPDCDRRRISAGAGALRNEVDDAAARVGLRFPVDPSSGAFCTVGGMASTNAAGPRSLRVGSTRRWVRALDCVFSDGSRAEVRRDAAAPPGLAARFLDEIAPALCRDEREHPAVHAGVRKESSGYATHAFAESGSLVDLLVGSEGTLALFTGVELDLSESSGSVTSVLGVFDDLEAAAAAAVEARDAGAVTCELLDRTFLTVAASAAQTLGVAGAEAVLLAEVECATDDDARAAAAVLARRFSAAGASSTRVALDTATATELWSLRHAASPTLARLGASLRSMQFIEDGVVPPDRLADYVRGVRRILSAHDTRGVIFGHAGDAHVHVNPLVDTTAPDWRARVQAILDETTELTAALGGSLSGEHGDGRLRAALAARVWTRPALERFRAVKRAFDPDGILNPGVKVPLPGQTAIGDVKYDPALPPLPTAAASALGVVDRERAYARFRLDLLAEAR